MIQLPCDQVCQLLVADWRFPLRVSLSSTNKTEHLNILLYLPTEFLLKLMFVKYYIELNPNLYILMDNKILLFSLQFYYICTVFNVFFSQI